MKLAWVTDIHLNFLESADRKRFYQDIVATKSNAVLVSGDIADPADMDGLIMYLSSNDASRYVTGSCFTIDGGISWGGKS